MFPPGVPVLSVEALSTLGWERYAHACLGIDTFGYSAPAKDVFEKVGLVPEAVANRAKQLVAWFEQGNRPVPSLMDRPF